MPKQIQNPTVGQILQRAFGLQGRVQPALDEIVVPVVSIGDLGQGNVPPVTGRATSWAFENPGAGDYARARFEVPGSIVALIEAVHVRLSASGNFGVRFTNTGAAIGTAQPKSYADGRLTTAGLSPAGVLTAGQDPAALAGRQANYWATTDGISLFPNWIVGSGDPGQFGFIEFAPGTAATAMSLNIQWREYRIA